MDLSAIFSDDQIAVIGCFVALAVCGLIALLSFQFGSAGRKSQHTSGKTLPFASRNRTETLTDSRKVA